ncbi:oxidoreductase [Zymomonas sp.]|uniref:oxidoreductase n=1 Tax=Zymomonas sp. TaxID=2068624 RepID=UPI0025ED478B|nr:oxidoreductase [Zymomonas sp.]MCA1956171.1 SDR family NAD(P)-dependent oxidoreductase [Zymomonas sp.]
MATWLITGCSSGLGHEIAKAALDAGHNVIVTARQSKRLQDFVANYPDRALAVDLDITRKDQIDAVIQAANTAFGQIDILVNNAGYGYRAAIEEGDDKEVSNLFQTNVFGAVSMMKAILPTMREKRQGIIVNISSVAPYIASPGSGYYSATKLALEGVSAALRNEVKSLGIKVMTVQPGAFRTDFAGRSLHGAKTTIADYDLTVGPRRKSNDTTSGKELGDPVKAAHILLDVITGSNLPDHLLLGSDAVKWAKDAIYDKSQEINRWEAVSKKTDF